MGAWGTAIFSDDTAADIRDEFTDLAAQGLSPEEATEHLIKNSAEILEDEDEAVVFWIALAATQWKLGRLLESVKARAIQLIDTGADLPRWDDAGRADIAARKKHLAKLRDQLHTPQPKPRKLKPQLKSSTDLKPGDVIEYRLNDRVTVRFCVTELWNDMGGTYSEMSLLELADGRPFDRTSVELAEVSGVNFTMLYHEPADRVTVVRSGVQLPEMVRLYREMNRPENFGNRHSATWDEFPALLSKVLSENGWL